MSRRMHLTEQELQLVESSLQMKPVTFESHEKMAAYYKSFQTEISDISLTNVMLWKDKYHFHYFTLEGFLFLANVESDRIYFSMPIGDYSSHEEVLGAVKQLKAIMDKVAVPLVIKKADERFKDILVAHGVDIEFESSRDESDYIYDFKEMKELSGNKFHKKKNQVNKFEKTTPAYEFKHVNEVNPEMIRKLLDDWCADKDCKGNSNLEHEYKGLMAYLEHFKHHETPIGLLFIEDELKGVIFGEVIAQNVLLIHIEKADQNYAGIYQMLGYAYYNALGDREIDFINREQDLGIEGLRKSKLSYHPVRLAEKFKIEFN